jgi:UDP-GlcNAc:undecaprenyl-phosphate GlcNAc-1-phosphate transferase
MDGANGILLSFFTFFYIIFFHQFDTLLFLFNIFLILTLLIYNLKGKFFCGNNGANLISIFISIVLIVNYNNKIPINSNVMLSAEVIFLIFILPGLDMLRIFSERIYKNESPFKADNSHFHHLLMSWVNKDLVFLPYTIIAIIPFILAIMNVDKMVIIVLFIILYILITYKLKKISKF